MNDLQRFKDLYDSLGIAYMLHISRELTLLILSPEEPKVFGPFGSLLCIVFEENKFMHMEMHEAE